MMSAQEFRCVNSVFAEGIASTVNVNGNDLPVVVRLNEMTDVPLINLFPKTTDVSLAGLWTVTPGSFFHILVCAIDFASWLSLGI